MSDLDKVVQVFRDEIERLAEIKSNFSGWQAVQTSLKRMADALEQEVEKK